MTTEEDFDRLLDSNIYDYHTRLVYSDWLRDRGDERADGYYVLGVYNIVPCMVDKEVDVVSIWRSGSNETLYKDNITDKWFERVDLFKVKHAHWHKRGKTRKEVEDAVARAFVLLDDEHKQWLLKGPK